MNMLKSLVGDLPEKELRQNYVELCDSYGFSDFNVREAVKEVLTRAEYETDILGIVKNLVREINEQR